MRVCARLRDPPVGVRGMTTATAYYPVKRVSSHVPHAVIDDGCASMFFFPVYFLPWVRAAHFPSRAVTSAVLVLLL